MTLEAIIELSEAGQPDEALKICADMLNENPDNAPILYSAGRIFLEAERLGMGLVFLNKALTLVPNKAAIWNALGRCHQEMNRLEEAERCFRKAIKLDDQDYHPLVNMGLLLLNRCEPERAIEYCDRALKLSPGNKDAFLNRGLAFLQLGRWKEGWEGYSANLGTTKHRKERIYGDETRWNGEKGKIIACYGEQGIGDELSFASCLPDLIRDSKKVVIETEASFRIVQAKLSRGRCLRHSLRKRNFVVL